MDKIITINRTFGSGGREIGLRLANELGVPFYDKDVISQLAIDEISDTKWTDLEEQCHPPFLDESILSRDVFQHYQEDTDRMSFFRQSEVIKKLSLQGVCVIVGRCADFLLGEKAVKIFAYADSGFCRLRKQCYYPNSTQKQVDEQIRFINRIRKGYYQRYTGQEWGSIYDSDLCINTSYCGIDGAVKTILAYLFPPKY